jgi:hypothetical protein
LIFIGWIDEKLVEEFDALVWRVYDAEADAVSIFAGA